MNEMRYPTKSAPSSVTSAPRCWICGAGGLRLVKQGNLPDELHPDAMRISDAHYGQTADIYRCERCGFLECPNLEGVLALYAQMSDDSYEETRDTRARQARALLNIVSRYKKAGRLLDVGAGSGILVEEARVLGLEARGIEPSGPLQATAAARGLPVTHGVLPHPDLAGPFDIVTSDRRHRACVRSRRADPADEERHGARRHLRRRHARRELIGGALDGLEMVAFSGGPYWLFQRVYAHRSNRVGGIASEGGYAADLVFPGALLGRTGR